MWETLLTQGGPWAVVAGQWTLIGWFLVTGRLVPHRIVTERIADYEAIIADKNATIALLQAQRAILAGVQVDKEPTV